MLTSFCLKMRLDVVVSLHLRTGVTPPALASNERRQEGHMDH